LVGWLWSDGKFHTNISQKLKIPTHVQTSNLASNTLTIKPLSTTTTTTAAAAARFGS